MAPLGGLLALMTSCFAVPRSLTSNVGGLKGLPLTNNLIQDAAQCPHICLLAVALAITHLRREVVRCAYGCTSHAAVRVTTSLGHTCTSSHKYARPCRRNACTARLRAIPRRRHPMLLLMPGKPEGSEPGHVSAIFGPAPTATGVPLPNIAWLVRCSPYEAHQNQPTSTVAVLQTLLAQTLQSGLVLGWQGCWLRACWQGCCLFSSHDAGLLLHVHGAWPGRSAAGSTTISNEVPVVQDSKPWPGWPMPAASRLDGILSACGGCVPHNTLSERHSCCSHCCNIERPSACSTPVLARELQLGTYISVGNTYMYVPSQAQHKPTSTGGKDDS